MPLQQTHHVAKLPPSTGVGFKAEHFADIARTKPDLGFFEVHAENFLGAGGAPHMMLSKLREDYALSIHGVGLSIGGDRIDDTHLARVKALCDRYQPDSFSEHLAWSSHGAEYLNDLLPLPYTQENLDRIIGHVNQVQDTLGRQLLLENPATYVTFEQSDIPEVEFLDQIAKRSGCGLLLDVNNVFVSCTNHGFDALGYLESFPLHRIGEIHLGGHDEEELPSGPLLIDSHGREVAEPVWALYQHLLGLTGPVPTLIEWDNDLPPWDELMAEADRAKALLNGSAKRRHEAAE